MTVRRGKNSSFVEGLSRFWGPDPRTRSAAQFYVQQRIHAVFRACTRGAAVPGLRRIEPSGFYCARGRSPTGCPAGDAVENEEKRLAARLPGRCGARRGDKKGQLHAYRVLWLRSRGKELAAPLWRCGARKKRKRRFVRPPHAVSRRPKQVS